MQFVWYRHRFCILWFYRKIFIYDDIEYDFKAQKTPTFIKFRPFRPFRPTICFAYFPTIFYVQQDLWKNKNILRSFRLMFNLPAVLWCKVKKYISGGAFCQVTLIKLLRVHVTFLFRPQQLHNFPNLAMSATGRKFPQSSN